MNINIYNYEEFLLLYVDNELTKAERLEVEAFVDANPDLQEELAMLKQLKLKPEAIRFEGKEMLMKAEQASLVNETNYEEFFLLYVDNELDATLRREVETFAANHPAFQQELSLLMQTKVEPAHEVVFPDKSLLYKQPEKDRKPAVILMWRAVAVAAMLLLTLGIFWLSSRDKEAGPGMATTEQPQKKNDNKIAAPSAPDQKSADQADEKAQPDNGVNNQQLANTQSNTSSKPEQKKPAKFDEPVRRELAYEPNRQDPVEVIDRAVNTADINKASNTANRNISTGLETASLNSGVTATGQPVSYEPVEPYVNPQFDERRDLVDVANVTVNKKNKLRGLFRKVTRVIEKTANLPAVEEKGILIGGFEIALK